MRQGGGDVPDLVVEHLNAILSHIFETIQRLLGVPSGVATDDGQIPLHRSKSVSHCCRVLGEIGCVGW